jgi:hypothetical protein
MPAHAQDIVFPFISVELLLTVHGHLVKLTTDLHLVSRLRIHGALLPTSPYACTMCIWTILCGYKTRIHKDGDCPVFCQTMPAITAFACQAKSFSSLISLYKFNMTHELACHVIFQKKLPVVKFFWETVLTNESKVT